MKEGHDGKDFPCSQVPIAYRVKQQPHKHCKKREVYKKGFLVTPFLSSAQFSKKFHSGTATLGKPALSDTPDNGKPMHGNV